MLLKLNGMEIKFERLPNNEIQLEDFEIAIEKDGLNIIEFRYEKLGDLFLLLCVKKKLDECNVKCRLLAWNMPYIPSNMENNEKLPFSLFKLGSLLNDYPPATAFEKIVVMQLFSDEVVKEMAELSKRIDTECVRIISWFGIDKMEEMEPYPEGQKKVMEIFEKNKTSEFVELVEKNMPITLELRYNRYEDLFFILLLRERLHDWLMDSELFIWNFPYENVDFDNSSKSLIAKTVGMILHYPQFQNVLILDSSIDINRLGPRFCYNVYPIKDWLDDIQKEIGFEKNDYIVVLNEEHAKLYAMNVPENMCMIDQNMQVNKVVPIIEDETFGRYVRNINFEKFDIPKGAKCIIVDRLCTNGENFVHVANILKSFGASEIYLVVTHCDESIFDGVLLSEDSPISMVYTSKSRMSQNHPKIRYMNIDVKAYLKQTRPPVGVTYNDMI